MKTTKRIKGSIWRGNGKYNKRPGVTDDKMISAYIETELGQFDVRCNGGNLRITSYDLEGRKLARNVIALPGSRIS